MLEYFIIFVIVGFILGLTLNNQIAIKIIIVLSILWIFVSGFWFIATFIELILGYTLAKRYINYSEIL